MAYFAVLLTGLLWVLADIMERQTACDEGWRPKVGGQNLNQLWLVLAEQHESVILEGFIENVTDFLAEGTPLIRQPSSDSLQVVLNLSMLRERIKS